MKPLSVILASASPRRVELLRQVVATFEVVPSAAAEVTRVGCLTQLGADADWRILAQAALRST